MPRAIPKAPKAKKNKSKVHTTEIEVLAKRLGLSFCVLTEQGKERRPDNRGNVGV